MFVRLNDDQALVYPIFITGRRASSYRRDDRNKYTSHTVANVSLTSRIAADDRLFRNYSRMRLGIPSTRLR